MPNEIAVCSLFRDSMVWHGRQINQVQRFFEQMGAQGLALDFFLVEGNSKDNTLEALNLYKDSAAFGGHNITILNCEVEGSEVVSLEDETRFKNLSKCGNLALNTAKFNKDIKYILWVESDIIIKDENLLRVLINDLEYCKYHGSGEFLGVAPIPTYENKNELYDTFVFKGPNGESFGPSMAPFEKGEPLELGAFGTCALMDADILRKYNLDFGDRCMMELCVKARNNKLRLLANSNLRVYHPNGENVSGRLV